MINKQRLIGEFIELVQIDSPSSKEGAVAKVLVKKLEQLGLDVFVDFQANKLVEMINYLTKIKKRIFNQY